MMMNGQDNRPQATTSRILTISLLLSVAINIALVSQSMKLLSVFSPDVDKEEAAAEKYHHHFDEVPLMGHDENSPSEKTTATTAVLTATNIEWNAPKLPTWERVQNNATKKKNNKKKKGTMRGVSAVAAAAAAAADIVGTSTKQKTKKIDDEIMATATKNMNKKGDIKPIMKMTRVGVRGEIVTTTTMQSTSDNVSANNNKKKNSNKKKKKKKKAKNEVKDDVPKPLGRWADLQNKVAAKKQNATKKKVKDRKPWSQWADLQKKAANEKLTATKKKAKDKAVNARAAAMNGKMTTTRV